MLARLQPLPDEIATSYLGRLMRVNALNGEKEALQFMSSALGLPQANQKMRPTVPILSAVAGMTVEQFVRQHTLIPLRRGITSYLEDVEHGGAGCEGVVRHTGVRNLREGLYGCPACVRSDVVSLGQSYWRRAHQIPGVAWCTKHDEPLVHVLTGSFITAPSDAIEQGVTADSQWCARLRRNAYVRTYLAVVDGLMETSRPYPVSKVQKLLAERARVIDLQTYSSRRGEAIRPLLSDLILKHMPCDWLATVLPSLATKRPGQYLPQVDGMLNLKRSSAAATVYALACSVLFESADAALLALRETCFGGVSAPSSCKHPPPSAEVLEALYRRCHGDHSLVAQRLSLPRRRVGDLLRHAGLPDLGPMNDTSALRQALEAVLLDRQSFTLAASKHGVSTAALERALRQAAGAFGKILREMLGKEGRAGKGKLRPAPASPAAVLSALTPQRKTLAI
jgi:hypothetical protein